MTNQAQTYPFVVRDRVIGPHTFDFVIADDVGYQWYGQSADQFMIERGICLRLVKPGMSIADCGAHHGMMSMMFSLAVGDEGRVFSYELLPENRAVIEQNIVINGRENIVVRPYGVSDRQGLINAALNSGNAVSSPAVSATMQLPVVCLDEEFANQRVDFIKIDVEGAELLALKGAANLLKQRPIIDLEIHNFLFEDRAQHLRSIGEFFEHGKWRFVVLPEIMGSSVETDAVDWTSLTSSENPHIFAIPT